MRAVIIRVIFCDLKDKVKTTVKTIEKNQLNSSSKEYQSRQKP